jgi:Zn-finger nucleic acid-binding protein
VNEEELERETACPRCERMMETHPYYGPGNVVIDNCPRCSLVWLDYGELAAIRDAPGRDRGQEDEADYRIIEELLRP